MDNRSQMIYGKHPITEVETLLTNKDEIIT